MNIKKIENFECPAFENYYNYTNEKLDQLLEYKYYLSGWLSLCIISFGITANLISIMVLSHRFLRKSSTNTYLLALSTCNLLSLMCILFMVSLRFTLVYPYRATYCNHWYENFINLAIPYLTPINQWFQLCGIYLIMAVSIDRYILIKGKVKLYTKSRRQRRRNSTRFTIILIFLFCFIFTLPNWFLYTSELIEHNSNVTSSSTIANSSFRINSYRTKYTSFGRNKLVRSLINVYLYIPFVFAFPIIVLFINNILIILKLVKIDARRRTLRASVRVDRNITNMLLIIVIVFLICQVPLTISHILIANYPNVIYEEKFTIYNSLTNILTCVNLSANFALFCFFAQEFRFTIKYLFGLVLENQPLRKPSEKK